MHSVTAATALALLSIAVLRPQDKPKTLPTPPPGATTLPRVIEPARSALERRDLLQQFRKRHPIEGFYQLRGMTLQGGAPIENGRGYLVVGRRHLSLHLYAPAGAKQANIQAAFRRYEIVANKLVMKTLLGHRNKTNGDIALDPPSSPSEHRFLLTGGVLRIYRAQDEYLEFERIE